MFFSSSRVSKSLQSLGEKKLSYVFVWTVGPNAGAAFAGELGPACTALEAGWEAYTKTKTGTSNTSGRKVIFPGLAVRSGNKTSVRFDLLRIEPLLLWNRFMRRPFHPEISLVRKVSLVVVGRS
jgi:hypothetical protein